MNRFRTTKISHRMQFIMWFSGETDVMWEGEGRVGGIPDVNITHSLVSRSHSYQMLPASGNRVKSLILHDI